MYTLRFPGCRLYVVNANSLIPIIERQTQTISFAPIESQAAAAVLGTSRVTNAIMARDPGSDHNHFSAFYKVIRPVLAPGKTLDEMLRRSFCTMSRSLDEQFQSDKPSMSQLFAWISHEITLAGTNAEYGLANPFQDPEVEKAWK